MRSAVRYDLGVTHEFPAQTETVSGHVSAAPFLNKGALQKVPSTPRFRVVRPLGGIMSAVAVRIERTVTKVTPEAAMPAPGSLAQSTYNELKARGLSDVDVMAFAGELLDLVASGVRSGSDS